MVSGATPFLGYTAEPPGCSPEGPGFKKSIFRERSAWGGDAAIVAALGWIKHHVYVCVKHGVYFSCGPLGHRGETRTGRE